MFELTVNISGLMWQSDWNGYEVGFPDSGVVGLYVKNFEDGPALFLYIDMETMDVLDMWSDEQDD